MAKALYVIFGFLFMSLGIAGMFLPLLPTTGPLLLAAWLFSKGSSRWRSWLIEHPVLGKYIYNYIKYKGTTSKIKIRAIITLWITLGISGILLFPRLWPMLILLGVGVGVTWHLLSLRTLSDEELRKHKRETMAESQEKQGG